MRLYSLYQKQNGKNWTRISSLAYKKASAIRIFQGVLLDSCFKGWPELQLRPIKGENEKIGELVKTPIMA